MDPNVKGIPDFWYTIFKNVSMLCEMMQEHDEPILKTLLDIKGKFPSSSAVARSPLLDITLSDI